MRKLYKYHNEEIEEVKGFCNDSIDSVFVTKENNTTLGLDLGKVLLLPRFGELLQWAVVGDTHSLGCTFDESIFHHKVAKENGTTLPQAGLFIIRYHYFYRGMIQLLGFGLLLGLWILLGLEEVASHGAHSFAKIGIQQVTFALTDAASVKVSPTILGSKGQNAEWVTVYISNLKPSIDDWIEVFSPANFSDSTCLPENSRVTLPYLCSAPIKERHH